MYPCPNCNKLENGKHNKIVRCECGIYKVFVKAGAPYWMKVDESALPENINKLYNKTKLER